MNRMDINANLAAYIVSQCKSGDWESVESIDIEQLNNLGNRAELATLVGIAKIRSEKIDEGLEFVRIAAKWGASRIEIARALVGSVHNHLARANMVLDDPAEAVKHLLLGSMLTDSMPINTFDISAQYVMAEVGLGNLQEAFGALEVQVADMTDRAGSTIAQMATIQTEIGLLRHELALAQRRGQLDNFAEASSPEKITKANIDRYSMSQLGQDVWILERLDFKRRGFFVEFGATDGVLLSNTWLLEKKFDWQGICAEPNPNFFKKLKNNRNCTVSNACIGRLSGETVEFVFADAYGGQTRFAAIDQHFEKRKAYVESGQTATLTTISLHDFLKENSAPRDIDYISIDIEGAEYDVLRSFPFSEWNIRFFTIEHNFSETRGKIRELLASNGYSCVEAQWDDWYEKID